MSALKYRVRMNRAEKVGEWRTLSAAIKDANAIAEKFRGHYVGVEVRTRKARLFSVAGWEEVYGRNAGADQKRA